MSRYRYGYMKTRDGFARLDWETGERLVHAIPDAPGGVQEPVFVPRSPDAPEGDGWVLFLVNFNAENRAELRVIDAMDPTGAAGCAGEAAVQPARLVPRLLRRRLIESPTFVRAEPVLRYGISTSLNAYSA
jgi:Lignostilbene-alpha,beta-dioxygenase and related enzymes